MTVTVTTTVRASDDDIKLWLSLTSVILGTSIKNNQNTSFSVKNSTQRPVSKQIEAVYVVNQWNPP